MTTKHSQIQQLIIDMEQAFPHIYEDLNNDHKHYHSAVYEVYEELNRLECYYAGLFGETEDAATKALPLRKDLENLPSLKILVHQCLIRIPSLTK